MHYTEHLAKTDESYEIRFNSSGDAIHVYYKDGEAIIFPTLYDFIRYIYLGDSAVERFYRSEDELNQVYENNEYNYYKLKSSK